MNVIELSDNDLTDFPFFNNGKRKIPAHGIYFVKDGERLILLTAHRRENLGEPMRHIFKAIKRIVDEFDDVKVIYPIHKNPLMDFAKIWLAKYK